MRLSAVGRFDVGGTYMALVLLYLFRGRIICRKHVLCPSVGMVLGPVSYAISQQGVIKTWGAQGARSLWLKSPAFRDKLIWNFSLAPPSFLNLCRNPSSFPPQLLSVSSKASLAR